MYDLYKISYIGITITKVHDVESIEIMKVSSWVRIVLNQDTEMRNKRPGRDTIDRTIRPSVEP